MLAAILCAGAAQAQETDSRYPAMPMHEQVLTMPGDPARPVSLEVTLFTPPGDGPFPLAVINHGATGASASNRGERYRFTVSAYYFLSRGYAVALPMARGFAGSGGDLIHLGCDLAGVAEGNARDIRAVIGELEQRPDIDRTRVVVAGQSFGAWNTLGIGTEPPPGVRGLVSFNAALRSSDCHTQDSSLIAAAGQLGARTALPSLWFYGENDSILPTATWRGLFDRYRRTGAHAELVDVGRYGTDSHQMLSAPESLPLWAPKVDAFLARVGLPSAVVFPGYLPAPTPPPTHYASLTDVAAVPFVTDQGRAAYEKFLAGTVRPRVFVIAPNTLVATTSGGYDPLGTALRNCNRIAPGRCAAYAVDDDVVWPGPKPGAPERTVTRTVRHDASTTLGAFYELKRDCSVAGVPTLRVTQPPAHGAATAAPQTEQPHFAADSPLAGCNAAAVPAMGLTYTPSTGYVGADAFTVEETDPRGGHHLIRLELTVS